MSTKIRIKEFGGEKQILGFEVALDHTGIPLSFGGPMKRFYAGRSPVDNHYLVYSQESGEMAPEVIGVRRGRGEAEAYTYHRAFEYARTLSLGTGSDVINETGRPNPTSKELEALANSSA